MARKEPVLTEMERTAPELAKRGRMSWCYDAPTPPLLSIPQRWPSLHLIEAPRCRISLDLTRILRAHSCARSTEPLLTPVLGFSPRRPSHHAYLSRITSDPATGLVSALSCAIVRSVHRRTTCPDIGACYANSKYTGPPARARTPFDMPKNAALHFIQNRAT